MVDRYSIQRAEPKHRVPHAGTYDRPAFSSLVVKGYHAVEHEKMCVRNAEIIDGSIGQFFQIPHKIITEHTDGTALKWREPFHRTLRIGGYQLAQPMKGLPGGNRSFPPAIDLYDPVLYGKVR